MASWRRSSKALPPASTRRTAAMAISRDKILRDHFVAGWLRTADRAILVPPRSRAVYPETFVGGWRKSFHGEFSQRQACLLTACKHPCIVPAMNMLEVIVKGADQAARHDDPSAAPQA